MRLTDPQGRRWLAEKRGAATYLLTRPGAIRWATATEIADWPRTGFEGLRRDGESWVRV